MKTKLQLKPQYATTPEELLHDIAIVRGIRAAFGPRHDALWLADHLLAKMLDEARERGVAVEVLR